MAIIKNTSDLLTQTGATLPNNTTQLVSPLDVREAVENVAVSSYNRLTDAPLVGLKTYSTLLSYENGQGVVYGGKIYISNQITVVGAFNPAHWTLYDNLTPAQKTKIDFITVTQAVDLDAIEDAVNGITNPYLNKGLWDASTGVFPGSGSAKNGWTYICSVPGTVDGRDFVANQDKITALVNNASTSTYTSNWFKTDGSDLVTSVNGSTGAVSVTPNATHTGDVTGDTVLTIGALKVTNGMLAGSIDNSKLATNPLARANHTGTQLASTISDIQTTITNNTDVLANTAKVTNATHTSEVTGATALTVQPIAISNKTLLVTPLGAEELLVNDAGTLKKVLVSALGGATLTQRALHVMFTTGSDITGVPYNLSKPYQTIEGALIFALAGDTIVVWESLTVTTTAATGIWKDGVNYDFRNNPTITKTTTGDIFNLVGATLPFSVTGNARFSNTTNAKHILQSTSTVDIDFNCDSISQTIGNCFALYSAGLKVSINCNSINNTGGSIFFTLSNCLLRFNFNRAVCSGTGIYADGGQNNFIIANGNYAQSTAGNFVFENGGSRGEYNIATCLGFSNAYSTNGASGYDSRMTVNGYANSIYNYNTDLVVNGTVGALTNIGGKVNVNGKVFTTTINGGDFDGCVVDSITITNGIAKVNSAYLPIYSFGLKVNSTGGTLFLHGFHQISGAGSRTVNGGTVICLGTVKTTSQKCFELISGTLDISGGKLESTTDDSSANCVDYQGGALIVNAGVLKTATSNVLPIMVTGSNRNIKVMSGGLTTNRNEYGGTLSAKYQRIKFTVDTLASTTININGFNYTSNLATKALIAADLVTQINADVPLPVTASQDSIGVDEYLYTTADVVATAFTYSDTNATAEIKTLPSYALTNTVGGTIIDSPNA